MARTHHARRGRVYDGNHGSPWHRYRGGSGGIAWRRKYMGVNGRLFREPLRPAECVRDDVEAQLHDLWLEEHGVEFDYELSPPKGVRFSSYFDYAEHVRDDDDREYRLRYDRDDLFDLLHHPQWWDDGYEEPDYYDYEYGSDEPTPLDREWVELWVTGRVDDDTTWRWRDEDYWWSQGDPYQDLEDELDAFYAWRTEQKPVKPEPVTPHEERNMERHRKGERFWKTHKRTVFKPLRAA